VAQNETFFPFFLIFSLIFNLNSAEKESVRSQNFIFVTFCLVVAMGMLQMRSVFERNFSIENELRAEIDRALVRVEKEKMKEIVLQNQIADIQAHVVALNLPERGTSSEWVQSLRVPASIQQIDLSSLLFEEGSKKFKDSKYEESIRVFHDLLERYPASPKVVEAKFLLAESFFRAGKMKECLDQIDEMIAQYPESRLTGYSMLRMSQILKAKNHNEETAEVLRIIMKSFSSEQGLVVQAQELLTSLEK
jgi:TolA-binding protein